ncbi:hypothetical protein Y694_04337 [Methylibium sp. T29-B]|nr:hypothetical protein Y694_04337 [Methylibium sp. T29-B]
MPSASRSRESLPSHSATSAAGGASSSNATCGEKRSAVASSRSSAAASTIHASSPTHCCHALKASVPPASPATCMSSTRVAADGVAARSASQTRNCCSKATDRAPSA